VHANPFPQRRRRIGTAACHGVSAKCWDDKPGAELRLTSSAYSITWLLGFLGIGGTPYGARLWRHRGLMLHRCGAKSALCQFEACPPPKDEAQLPKGQVVEGSHHRSGSIGRGAERALGRSLGERPPLLLRIHR